MNPSNSKGDSPTCGFRRTFANWAFLIAVTTMTMAKTASGQATNDWFTMDAAGGASGSGAYLINDTLGQADAGSMTSANYRINGGFWALEGFGALNLRPDLHIAIAGTTTVLLWWPSPSSGFILQQNLSVSNPATWSDVSGLVSDNGFTRSITLPVDSATRFYRLQK